MAPLPLDKQFSNDSLGLEFRPTPHSAFLSPEPRYRSTLPDFPEEKEQGLPSSEALQTFFETFSLSALFEAFKLSYLALSGPSEAF